MQYKITIKKTGQKRGKVHRTEDVGKLASILFQNVLDINWHKITVEGKEKILEAEIIHTYLQPSKLELKKFMRKANAKD